MKADECICDVVGTFQIEDQPCRCINNGVPLKQSGLEVIQGDWRDGLVVGRRTCDVRVAGSRPGHDAAAQQP